MKIKIYLLFIFISISGLSAGAATVIPLQASLVAKKFFFERANQFYTVDYQDIIIKNIVTEEEAGLTVCYGISMKAGGFVIIAADDAVVPVLGYSFEGSYTGTDMPENFQAWMKQYKQSIAWGIHQHIEASKEIKEEWDRLASADPDSFRQLKGQKAMQPLISSNWDQGKFYNTHCPADAAGPDGHALTGCVATAMGQIMYYYRWPEQGTGSYTYQHPVYGTISADFGNTTYHWNNMQNQLSAYNDGVSELLFHLGASVDMNYGPTGSGMWNHKAAYSLGTYFKYLPTTQYVWRDTTNLDWDSLVISHLDRRQPLYYAGWSDYQYISGHAFVCDGYQDSNYCHFNWGWSGAYNGYFYLNALNPGGSNFNLVQELIINIYPDTLQYAYPAACQGNKVLHYLNGSIEDGSGPINLYPDNTDCSWLIDPQLNPEDSVSSITISFQQFDTETGHDIVTIYDGPAATYPVLGSFSGNTIPPVLTSSGNKVLVVFTSDSSTTATGWFASYRSNFPEYCVNSTLTALTGTISDGSGPKNYLDNTLCTWTIQPPNAAGLTLTFTAFQLQAVKDFVEVYDLNTSALLGRFSGDQIPPELTAPSGAMYIIFKSNGSVVSQGWSANYTVTNLGIESRGDAIELELFPNPSSSSIVFALKGLAANHYRWEMLDNYGQCLLSEDVKGNLPDSKELINVSKLKAGLYFLRVFTDKGIVSRKVMVCN